MLGVDEVFSRKRRRPPERREYGILYWAYKANRVYKANGAY